MQRKRPKAEHQQDEAEAKTSSIHGSPLYGTRSASWSREDACCTEHADPNGQERSTKTRLVPRSQKDPRSWVRWVQGLGPWWILDLETSFLSWDSGNPGHQNCDLPQDLGNPGPRDFDMQRDPENPGPQNFDCRKSLKTQDLKIWICGETQEPRTQNLKILMSRDFKSLDPTSFNTEFHAEHCARELKRWWARTIGLQKLEL